MKQRLTTTFALALIVGGIALVLLGVALEHGWSSHSLSKLLMRDSAIHLGVALIVAVVVARVVDVRLSERTETERMVQSFADMLRRVFNLSSRVPTETLSGLVDYFLATEWLRDDIRVVIALTPGPTVAGRRFIRADTTLTYGLRCISDREGVTHSRFETSQKLSPVEGPAGYVSQYTIESPEGRRTVSDRTVLDGSCEVVDGIRRFRLGLPANSDSTTRFAMDMTRFLEDHQEDPWDSRVPAEKLTVEVTFDPSAIALEAFDYSPGSIPGRVRTERRLPPDGSESRATLPNGQVGERLWFSKERLRPFEGIIIRPTLKRKTGVSQ